MQLRYQLMQQLMYKVVEDNEKLSNNLVGSKQSQYEMHQTMEKTCQCSPYHV